MRPELHVALCVADFCVRMGCGVVKEPRNSTLYDCCGLALFAGNVTERDEHGCIDFERIVQEASDYFLDDIFFFRTQLWRGVVLYRVLDLGPIGGGDPIVRGIASFFSPVYKFEENSVNIAWHGYVHVLVGAVPGEC